MGKGTRNMTPRQVFLLLFDLKESELAVYLDLLRNGPATAKVLAERMEKDRSPVYKVVTRLHSCGLVNKASRKEDGGGIYYVYQAIDPDRAQDLLMERVEVWHSAMDCAARRSSSDLRKGP